MQTDSIEIDILCVSQETTLLEIMERQTQAAGKGLPTGIAIVVNAQSEVEGVVSDGDVRRAINEHKTLDVTASRAMTRNPIVFDQNLSFQEIINRLPAELAKRGRRSRKFLGKVLLVDNGNRPVGVLDYHQLWEQKVATHRHIVVIGLGYVGLTLGLTLAEDGFNVTGVDSSEQRLDQLKHGDSYVHEPGITEILKEQIGKNLCVTNEIPDDGDVFIISVGTPINKDGASVSKPRLEELEAALTVVAENLQRGGLVILRSTVPIGVTRQTALPVLEEVSGLKGGRDFHLAFAPERTAEGSALSELRSLPQMIGGLTQDCVEAAAAVFRELTPTIVRMESLESAELGKLINNSFRDVVFSFANQMVQIGVKHNIDVVETINSANRGYPRDTVPLPSPGVGGPCLTKDPYILAAACDDAELEHSLSIHGRAVNESMHDLVAESMIREFRELGNANPTVMICGLAFKGHPETGDMRESSSVFIANILTEKGVNVLGNDGVATADEIREFGITPTSLEEGLSNCDGVLFLNNHVKYARLNIFETVRNLRPNPVIFDGWHLFRSDDVLSARPCIYLGMGVRRSSVMSEEPKV